MVHLPEWKISVLHFMMCGFLLLSVYATFYVATGDGRGKWFHAFRTKQRFKRKNEAPYLYKWLHSDKVDRLFRKAGLPRWLTSYRFNVVRIALVLALMFVNILGVNIGIETVSRDEVKFVIILMILVSPVKYFPLHFVLNLLCKRKERALNLEIYSLYSQLKADLSMSENTRNIYSLVFSYRHYFDLLRPIIEGMLSVWNGEEGSKKAWDFFAKETASYEGELLATLMTDVEEASTSVAVQTLEEKHSEFAEYNYNSFVDYLKDRENVTYFVIYACAFAIFSNPLIAQYLQYKDIMNELNML